MTAFDPEIFKAAFPVFSARPELHYLDNGATTQMPAQVIDAMAAFERDGRANVKRSVHALAEKSTQAFEAARKKLATFVGGAPNEIVFTTGTTSALNIVAHGLCAASTSPKRILVSVAEHHSNIVPWQIAAARHGHKVVPIPLDETGVIDPTAFGNLMGDDVIAIAVAHISNVTGARQPVEEMAAQKGSAALVVDGAQAAIHGPLDMSALGADFYAFSGHKMFGPTGIGVLWGKADRLASLPPTFGGGEMIHQVSFQGTSFAKPPHVFEPGTPPILSAIGLGATVDFLGEQDRQGAELHLQGLTQSLWAALADHGVTLVGPEPGNSERGPIVSFTLPGAHPHDICQILDSNGVATRGGHHCAQPLMEHFGVLGTVRASLAAYNTQNDIDALLVGLDQARKLLGLSR
ncbi:MAG: aminotransferase class V-fold PLP-dependent enzyme [Alphaproteobacteria bacterium]